jgi:hypothetical protein
VNRAPVAGNGLDRRPVANVVVAAHAHQRDGRVQARVARHEVGLLAAPDVGPLIRESVQDVAADDEKLTILKMKLFLNLSRNNYIV